jgi:DNA-binding XRE family transcriptional regulator
MSKHETRIELPPEDRAKHRVIQETLGRERKDLNDLIASGDIDPESVTTVEDHEEFENMILLLRETRKKLRLSLRDVADLIGPVPKTDAAALSRLESGVNNNPTVNTLFRYARALNRRIVWSLEEISDDSQK